MNKSKQKYLVSIVLPIFLLSSCQESPKQKDSFDFIVSSDLHYISPSLTDNGEYFVNMMKKADGKMEEYCEPIVNCFVDEVIASKPDYLFLTGDLSFNGAKASHIDLTKKLSRIEEAGIEVLVIPGNHDIDYPYAASYSGNSYSLVESLSKEEFASIYGDFGYKQAISTDVDSLSYVYQLTPKTRVIAFDVNAGNRKGSASASTLSWLRKSYSDAKRNGQNVISLSHQPAAIHSPLFTSSSIDPSLRIEKLYKEFEAPISFAGHLHIQDTYEDGDFAEVLTESLLVHPCQYGMAEVKEGELTYIAKRLDLASYAAKEGLDDASLSDFASYGESYFAEVNSRKLLESIESNAELSEPQKKKMSEAITKLNRLYFEGGLSSIDASAYQGEDYPWGKLPLFLSSYVSSILSNAGANKTRLFHVLTK